MKLQESLLELERLETLSTEQLKSEDLKELGLLVRDQANAVAYVIQGKNNELEYIGSQIQRLKDFKASKTRSLGQYKDLIHDIVSYHGDIETQTSYLKRRAKESEKVLITDFDECMEAYPLAMVVHTEDNKRTITLEKKTLLAIMKDGKPEKGFKVVKNVSTWLDARVRGQNAN